VRGRFDNRWLALAVALTGLVATMPYIALQLVGMEVVIGAMGIPTSGMLGDLPLMIAFIVLAAFTYTSGLRAPAMIAVVKDVLIYVAALAAIVVVPMHFGGSEAIFAKVPPTKLLLAALGPNTTGSFSAYATLALGSALALYLYPHSLTGILSASDGQAIKRNAIFLPAYSLVLGVLALMASWRWRSAWRRCRNSPKASGSTAQISRFRRCSLRCFHHGSSVWSLPRSLSARSCRRRSCPLPRRTSIRATSIANSSVPTVPRRRRA
jgi:hypothetical protein